MRAFKNLFFNFSKANYSFSVQAKIRSFLIKFVSDVTIPE
jgi:hypothetical protein